MSREQYDVGDWRWVLRCDATDCLTIAGPFEQMPDLEQFAKAGWWIGATQRDRCPRCRAPVGVPSHPVMQAVKRRKLVHR